MEFIYVMDLLQVMVSIMMLTLERINSLREIIRKLKNMLNLFIKQSTKCKDLF